MTGYNVYYGPASRSYTNKLDAGSATNLLINGLVEGGTYYFAATAYNILGIESDYSAEVSYTVPGLASNKPPTLNAVSNVTLNEDAAQQTVSLSGISSGTNSEVQTLVVTASSSNPGLIPNPTVSYTSPNTTGTLTFTPIANAAGSATITVSVNDGGVGGVTSHTFTVTVNPVNDAPTLNAPGNVTLKEDATQQTVTLTGISSGAANESQTLTVTASSSNTGLIPNPAVNYTNPNSTGTLTFTPVANASGSAIITVTVNDGAANNNLVTRTFTITVSPVNDAPTLNPIGNLSLNSNPGSQTVNLSGISSGAANESQTLAVTATSSNPSLIPNPAVNYTSANTTGSLTFTPALNASGSAIITVNVNDGGSSNNIVSRAFTVIVNSAPTISTIPSQTIGVSSNAGPISFTVSDRETAASSLVLSASSSAPALISASTIAFGGSGNTRTVTLTPVAGQTGTANITVSVSDGLTSSSTTFALSVLGIPPAPQGIMIVTNGAGSILGAKPQSMAVGKVYTLTAVPDAGQEFVGWSGSISTAAAKVSFVMRSNLVLRANFVPSPYTPGSYNGLFYNNDALQIRSSGSFTLLVKAHGVYSGSLQLGATKRPFSGKLDLQCRATNFIAQAYGSPLVLTLQLGTNDTAGQASGDLTDGNWTAQLRGDLAPYGKTRPAPFAANYTVVLPSDTAGTSTPEGHGYGTVRVSALGKVLFAGTLADGTKVTQSASLSKDGAWPLYVSLYTGKGVLVSWMNFAARDQDDLNGTVRWLKSADTLAKYYPAGFDAESGMIGSKFVALVGTNILNAPVAELDFKNGNLPAEFQNIVQIAANNKVANTSSNLLQVKLSSKAGTFLGKVTDPSTGYSYSFGGVVLQKAKAGYGSLLGSNRSSGVELKY